MNEKEVICGLYLRVSIEDQVRDGFSLDEQEESMKRLCDYKKYKIYKIYREEGISAKSMKRPKFQEMVQDMKDGKINKIIVYKLDRLTRSIKDLETICSLLEEYHCSLESEIVKRIFDLYVKGNSVCSIVKTFNEEKVLNKNWRTTTIDNMLSNYIYVGSYQHKKRIKDEETILFEDVCPAIIDKKTFEIVQKQKRKNQKNYKRKYTLYLHAKCCLFSMP